MSVDANKLLAADRSHIVSTLSTISGKEPAAWLSAAHPGTDGQLPNTWKKANAWTASQRVELVAFAGPTHCIDGWSYASRALAAFVAGDFHAARHLAYYAQLRAGLSILAGVGVGVFNGINFAVLSNGVTERIDPKAGDRSGLGTHVMVWEGLDRWSQSSAGAEIFLKLIKIRNYNVRECLDFIWPGSNSLAVASQLVGAWGLDLKRGKDEHKYRKVSSYVPQAFNNLQCPPVDVSSFLSSIWRLFEPSAGPGFDALDRFLLRAALHKQHEILEPGVALASGGLDTRYDSLPDPIRAIASKAFLLGVAEPEEPLVVRLARAQTAPAAAHEMIARSLLLLRAALAITNSNLSDAGISGATLRPWLNSLAVQRGFFQPAAMLDHMADLWTDVELALEDMDAAGEPIPGSLHEWFSRSPIGIPTVSEAERIGLWSLCA